MSDEIREFHLDGKQLAFLVISAIGVSVVVFLCGVMVGRGVRGLPASEPAEIALGALAAASDTGAADADLPVATGGRNQKEKKLIPNENLSYPERLTAPTPEAFSEPLPAPKAAAAAPAAAARAPSPARPAARESARGGFDVQVIALRQFASADEKRRELVARHKQYKAMAFVVETDEGEPRLFRVRVGPFASEREARAAAEQLKKDYKNLKVYPHR